MDAPTVRHLVCVLVAACVAALQPLRAAEAPFGARALSALPTQGWLTNGGNLANQRYSPLTQINRDNVANLRAQPLAHDGVIYIMTGDNDAFAVSVETGAILWEY